MPLLIYCGSHAQVTGTVFAGVADRFGAPVDVPDPLIASALVARGDFIVFRPEPEIFEIKTVKGYPFKLLKKAPWGADSDTVFAYLKQNWLDKIITNYTQLQLYIWALEQDHGYLIYFDKNSGERLDLLIQRDEIAIQKALSWYAQTRSLIDKARAGLQQGQTFDEALPEKHPPYS